MKTTNQIAEYMLAALRKDGWLYQEEIVHNIADKFGDVAYYVNENGGLSINREVLKAFRKLTEGDVVWERSERAWRMRMKHEDPKRRLAE